MLEGISWVNAIRKAQFTPRGGAVPLRGKYKGGIVNQRKIPIRKGCSEGNTEESSGNISLGKKVKGGGA